MSETIGGGEQVTGVQEPGRYRPVSQLEVAEPTSKGQGLKRGLLRVAGVVALTATTLGVWGTLYDMAAKDGLIKGPRLGIVEKLQGLGDSLMARSEQMGLGRFGNIIDITPKLEAQTAKFQKEVLSLNMISVAEAAEIQESIVAPNTFVVPEESIPVGESEVALLLQEAMEFIGKHGPPFLHLTSQRGVNGGLLAEEGIEVSKGWCLQTGCHTGVSVLNEAVYRLLISPSVQERSLGESILRTELQNGIDAALKEHLLMAIPEVLGINDPRIIEQVERQLQEGVYIRAEIGYIGEFRRQVQYQLANTGHVDINSIVFPAQNPALSPGGEFRGQFTAKSGERMNIVKVLISWLKTDLWSQQEVRYHATDPAIFIPVEFHKDGKIYGAALTLRLLCGGNVNGGIWQWEAPTATPTITDTPTETPTSTITPTPSVTPTPSWTWTPPWTSTPTETPRYTDTPTVTATPTSTGTPSPSPSATASPSSTPSASPTSTETVTRTPRPSETMTQQPTKEPSTDTPTVSPTPKDTPTLTSEPTKVPSTSTSTPTNTLQPSPTTTASPVPTYEEPTATATRSRPRWTPTPQASNFVDRTTQGLFAWIRGSYNRASELARGLFGVKGQGTAVAEGYSEENIKHEAAMAQLMRDTLEEQRLLAGDVGKPRSQGRVDIHKLNRGSRQQTRWDQLNPKGFPKNGFRT